MTRYLIILLLLPFYLNAQYDSIIRTGRPGQAIGAFTVGKNTLQFQQGIDYYSLADSKITQKGFISNNVIRYGILETVELSALIDYQYEQNNFDTISINQNGVSNIHLGFRAHFNDQNGFIPTTGFQMRLKIHNVTSNFVANNLAPLMVFVANWNLPKNMSIGTNWILSYNDNHPNPTGKYILNFGFPIYNKLSGFIENYGQASQNVFQTRFDSGVAYLLNKNIQLDLSAGYGSNQNIQDYFVSAGISWRIINLKK